ncbi:MAG: tRNA-queuosine alpha-mannosyltransferase domain-containing protein [Anaerolineae bacterium]
MLITLLEPYDTGSHHAWLHGFVAHSAHQVLPLTLDGRFWKWRMHGGAVTLAGALRQLGRTPDLLLAGDMLDLTTLLALTRDLTHDVPVALYMHENQLTYPPRPGEKRDLHYGFINYASMLCADRVLFNSQYHLDTWFDELPRLLKHFPDYNELQTVRALRARSEVLPLGMALRALDAHRPAEPRRGPPLILWNHRWEYDKNPEGFLEALYSLAARGLDFRVVLLGEVFVRVPPAFEEAKRRLGDRIVQFGYVEGFEAYAQWLWRSDIVVSTAIHDFFGAAVVEAIYCDTLPILPDRLAYPQFVPQAQRARCLYRNADGLVALLQNAIEAIDETRATSLRSAVACYDWSHMALVYDQRLEDVSREARIKHPWTQMKG